MSNIKINELKRPVETRFTRQRVPIDRMGSALDKWPVRMLEEGYLPFPKRLMRSFHRIFVGPLGMDHFATMLAAADFKRRNLSRLPNVEFLAFTAGLEPDRLEQCLYDIHQVGVVSVQFVEDPRYGRVVDVDLDPLDELVMQTNADQ